MKCYTSTLHIAVSFALTGPIQHLVLVAGNLCHIGPAKLAYLAININLSHSIY